MYSICEIEKLTGVKAHVLRYWESVIPSIAPKKGLSGRRVYSQRDFEIIQRLKHLIYEEKFTIEGARDNIIQSLNLTEANADIMSALHELREELTSLYLLVKKYR